MKCLQIIKAVLEAHNMKLIYLPSTHTHVHRSIALSIGLCVANDERELLIVHERHFPANKLYTNHVGRAPILCALCPPL